MKHTDKSTEEFTLNLRDILGKLYPEKDVDRILGSMGRIVERYENHETILEKRKKYDDRIVLSEDDAILITYADTIRTEGEKPLRTLHGFLKNYVKSAITCVHILPFFPSSSTYGVGPSQVIDNTGITFILGGILSLKTPIFRSKLAF